jgi:hypothetical protein
VGLTPCLLYTILCVVFEARVINLCGRDIATTSNLNGPETSGLIFTHLQQAQSILTKPKHEDNNKNNKSDT